MPLEQLLDGRVEADNVIVDELIFKLAVGLTLIF